MVPQGEIVRLGGNVEAALAHLQSVDRSEGEGAKGAAGEGWAPTEPNLAAAAGAQPPTLARLGPPSSSAPDGACACSCTATAGSLNRWLAGKDQ